MEHLLLLMLLPPLAGAVLNGVFGRRFAQAIVSWMGCGAAGLSMLFALAAAAVFSRRPPASAAFVHTYFNWIESGQLRADFALYYDRLTLVMTLTVTVVAFIIHLYSRGYMKGEGGYYRYFAYLNLFLFMMLLLVAAANFLLLFVGWEGVGLCSYLLIGFYFTKKSAADAGKKAFIVTRIGDAGFTVGVALLFWTFGSLSFPDVFSRLAALPSGALEGTMTVIGILLFLGAVGKSAQLPLYVWLPDAMEGPTPVSALIHAATMVTAGVYMVARSSILYAHAPVALEIIAGVGGVTAFYAATIALCQNDLKRILAYSTISQLGYMFVGCGVGLFAAGIFHLMTHAYFKSLLFLAAGSVMHALQGELDIRKMGGLRHKMKITFWTFLVATLAISGVPMFSGFFSKDEILAGAYLGPLPKPWLYWLGTLTAALTALYMFRALLLTFSGQSRGAPEIERHVHESSRTMTAPLIVLAFFSVVVGYVSWPRAWGGSEWFDDYLSPVFLPAEQLLHEARVSHARASLGSGALMIFVVLAAGLGILAASWLYWKHPHVPAQLAERLRGLYRILVNKYYVDELYDLLVVRPVALASERVLWRGMDAGAVDTTLVHGSANLTKRAGKIMRWPQSGNTRSYATWVLLGAVLWLAYALLWRGR